MNASAFDTTGYIPFDSYTVEAFSLNRRDNTLNIAFTMLLLYEHVITLDKEVEWIWTLRWRLPKILFIINRYVITPLLLLDIIPRLIFPISISFCKFHGYVSYYVPVLNFSVAELLFIIRVCSLYGHRNFVVGFLSVSFVLSLISAIVLQMLFIRAVHITLSYQFMPGCWEIDGGEIDRGEIDGGQHRPNTWAMWIPMLLIECIIMLLTAYKLISYRKQPNHIITMFARDSILYFAFVFACVVSVLVLNIQQSAGVNVEVPAQCAASIAVGRMMMNIRGLVMDDPKHTIHLQTLEFAGHTNSGSGGEAIALGPV